MKITVIISTYNNPDWLDKVLVGYACQSDSQFDIIIADDGSTEETADVIRRAQRDEKLCIHHLWHADEGFRKTLILNKAIAEATGNYLIISDGDCIPTRDFVATHRRLATPECFLSGGYFKLPMEVSRTITPEDIRSGRFSSYRWLRTQGVPLTPKFLKLVVPNAIAPLADRLTPTRATWNGMNSSGWRKDIIAVNGFDHRMRYGGLDRELGERLMNAGKRPIQIRHRAICLHLDHARGYANREDLERNLAIRRTTRREKRTWTDHGLTELKTKSDV